MQVNDFEHFHISTTFALKIKKARHRCLAFYLRYE